MRKLLYCLLWLAVIGVFVIEPLKGVGASAFFTAFGGSWGVWAAIVVTFLIPLVMLLVNLCKKQTGHITNLVWFLISAAMVLFGWPILWQIGLKAEIMVGLGAFDFGALFTGITWFDMNAISLGSIISAAVCGAGFVFALIMKLSTKD